MSVDRENETSVRLLPCPFCGKEPTLQLVRGEWGYTSDEWVLQCKPCSITRVERAEHWSAERGNYRDDEGAQRRLLEWWNRREGAS